MGNDMGMGDATEIFEEEARPVPVSPSAPDTDLDELERLTIQRVFQQVHDDNPLQNGKPSNVGVSSRAESSELRALRGCVYFVFLEEPCGTGALAGDGPRRAAWS